MYWNYLAQTPGNDGYGLLALGVVRNDSTPGKTANQYAQNYAREFDGKVLSEREWEAFGVDLMRKDFAHRLERLNSKRPDQALNLPVKDVQDVHADAFKKTEISPNAWTPNELITAARNRGGEAAAETVWTQMLDNRLLGTLRAFHTGDAVHDNWHHLKQPLDYLDRLKEARIHGGVRLPYSLPNRIGSAHDYYDRDPANGQWTHVLRTLDDLPSQRWQRTAVSDPRLVAELDDAHALRNDRLAMRDNFHPKDPHRTIAISPYSLAEAEFPQPAAPAVLSQEDRNLRQAIKDLLPPTMSEERLLELTVAARTAGIRADTFKGITVHPEDEMKLVLHGTIPGFQTTVDLKQPQVAQAESLQRLDAYHEQQAERLAQFQQQQERANAWERLHGPGPGGPSVPGLGM